MPPGSSTPSSGDPTRRFSDRAAYYVRSRPRYPRALLDFCTTQLSLGKTDRVADIGSGTGFLTELFLENGNPVLAVEPNAEMRAAAEARLGHLPNFHSVNATAEATTLPDHDVHLIVAGQAFHWFDRKNTRAEFQRISRPDGWAVLVWNERRTDDDPFAAEYERIVEEFTVDQGAVRQKNDAATSNAALAEFFAPQSYAVVSFPNPQSLDLPGLLARAMSSSFLPLPGHPRCDEMLRRLESAFARHAVDGRIVQNYDTRTYYGRVVFKPSAA